MEMCKVRKNWAQINLKFPRGPTICNVPKLLKNLRISFFLLQKEFEEGSSVDGHVKKNKERHRDNKSKRTRHNNDKVASNRN